MVLRVALTLLFAGAALATDRPACASGCTYPTIQAAIDAFVDGDIITLNVGETYSGNWATLKNVSFRSTLNASLPATGYRVDTTRDAPLMAILNGGSSSPALFFGAETLYASSVDTSANTITFGSPNYGAQSLPAVNQQISCWADGTLPGGMPRGKYWVKTWNSGTRTATLSTTPGGTTLDITSTGTNTGGDDFYRHTRCGLVFRQRIAVSGLKIIGTGPNLITVGDNNQTTPEYNGVTGRIHHNWLTGAAGDWSGPLTGISVGDGSQLLIDDNVIEHIQKAGYETKAIAIANSDGVTIHNNWLAASSITILVGGSYQANGDVSRNIVVTQNALVKPGYLHLRIGSGAPSGNGYYGNGSGGWYRDSGASQCYEVQSNFSYGAAVSGSLCASSALSTKNLTEFKDCDGCRFEDNYLQGQSEGDGGQGMAFSISVLASDPGIGGNDPAVSRVHNTIVRRNRIRYSWTGLYARNSNYAAALLSYVPVRNVLLEDNLMTEAAKYPELCHSATCDPTNGLISGGLLISTAAQGLTARRNTWRGDGRFGVYFNIGTTYLPSTFTPLRLIDNLMQSSAYPTGGDSLGNCAALSTYGNVFFTGDKHYSAAASIIDFSNCATYSLNAVASASDPLWTSSTNHHLQAGSPYITAAVDGGPSGADVDLVEQYSNAALAGTPTAKTLMALQVEEGVGANAGKLIFRAAAEMGSCTATVYTTRARSGGTIVTSASPITVTGITAGERWYKVACPNGLQWIDSSVVR